VKKIGGTAAKMGEYLQKCRMRAFSLMVLNDSKLFISNALCIFVNKTGKGYRSTFFPTSPHPGFETWIFSQPPFRKGGIT
jgi:hypothetical protein